MENYTIYISGILREGTNFSCGSVVCMLSASGVKMSAKSQKMPDLVTSAVYTNSCA